MQRAAGWLARSSTRRQRAWSLLPGRTRSQVTFTPTDTVDYSSPTATVALTVNQATPTVTLTSSLNPANYGTPVTFTAQTAASATGSMTFYDGATIIGTGTISGGIATYTKTTTRHRLTHRHGQLRGRLKLLACGIRRLARSHHKGPLRRSP
jgi:hypothetical protein